MPLKGVGVQLLSSAPVGDEVLTRQLTEKDSIPLPGTGKESERGIAIKLPISFLGKEEF